MAETRDRIIAATHELFRRSGYHGTSLSQISAASEATIGSIYHFFPGGKEALAVAVIETTGASYRQLFESIAAQATDPASAYVDFFAGAGVVLAQSGYLDPCPIGSLAREVAHTREPLRLAVDELAIWFPQHAQSMDAALAQHLESLQFDPATGQCARPLPADAQTGCGGSSCS